MVDVFVPVDDLDDVIVADKEVLTEGDADRLLAGV